MFEEPTIAYAPRLLLNDGSMDAFRSPIADPLAGQDDWVSSSDRAFEARQQDGGDEEVEETVEVIGRRPTRGTGGGPPPESPFDAEDGDDDDDDGDDRPDIFDPDALPPPGYCTSETAYEYWTVACTIETPGAQGSTLSQGMSHCVTVIETESIPVYDETIGQWACQPLPTTHTDYCEDQCRPLGTEYELG